MEEVRLNETKSTRIIERVKRALGTFIPLLRDRELPLLRDSFQESREGGFDFLLDQAPLLSIYRAQTTNRILFLTNPSPLRDCEVSSPEGATDASGRPIKRDYPSLRANPKDEARLRNCGNVSCASLRFVVRADRLPFSV